MSLPVSSHNQSASLCSPSFGFVLLPLSVPLAGLTGAYDYCFIRDGRSVAAILLSLSVSLFLYLSQPSRHDSGESKGRESSRGSSCLFPNCYRSWVTLPSMDFCLETSCTDFTLGSRYLFWRYMGPVN